MLGPNFDSTFLTSLGHFPFSKYVQNHYFYSVFSKTKIFKPIPKKLKNTICEHNCANDVFGLFFFVLGAGGGLQCPVLGVFFDRNEKQKSPPPPPQKKKHKMQTRKPLSFATKHTTQKQNNTGWWTKPKKIWNFERGQQENKETKQSKKIVTLKTGLLGTKKRKKL